MCFALIPNYVALRIDGASIGADNNVMGCSGFNLKEYSPQTQRDGAATKAAIVISPQRHGVRRVRSISRKAAKHVLSEVEGDAKENHFEGGK